LGAEGTAQRVHKSLRRAFRLLYFDWWLQGKRIFDNDVDVGGAKITVGALN
jgi:hypothetical protein